MVREARNANKIEHWRLSRVPIDPTETILQGDMLVWDAGRFRATKLAGAASGANFVGVSDTSNPIMAAGVLSTDFQSPRVNVLQAGLVEMIMGEAVSGFPFDNVTVGADSQTVLKTGATGANRVGVIDTSYGATGKLFAAGDPILIWLKVPTQYAACS